MLSRQRPTASNDTWTTTSGSGPHQGGPTLPACAEAPTKVARRGPSRALDWRPVANSDLQDYEQRVAGATRGLGEFITQLADELNTQRGGFRWWTGFSDWKTITMLSDYLLQSLSGTSEALISASLQAEVHRHASSEEDEVYQKARAEFSESGSKDIEEFLGALLNAPQARRRSLMITESAEACLFHLAQTLDRLSAAVIIVGGFGFKDVATSYWSNVEKLAAELDTLNQANPNPVQPSPTSRQAIREALVARFEPRGSPGRAAQEALVAPVLGWQSFGPTGWLSWMRDTRQGLTHRSPAAKFNVAVGDHLTRLFYRQPRWSEIQALVFGSKPPNRPIFDTFVLSASTDVLDGLCDSTAQLVESLTNAMVTCWAARRAQPAMIAQPGRQWRRVDPDEHLSQFAGYGDTVTLDSREIRLSPIDTKRWLAARIHNDRRRDWYN
jgi:hypothetical protein